MQNEADTLRLQAQVSQGPFAAFLYAWVVLSVRASGLLPLQELKGTVVLCARVKRQGPVYERHLYAEAQY